MGKFPADAGGGGALTADELAAIQAASAPSGANPFITDSAMDSAILAAFGATNYATLRGLQTPAAVAGYTTVGSGATWADFATQVGGFVGSAALANATSLKGKTSAIAAGDFATKWWCIDVNAPFAATAEYGLIMNAGAAAQAVMSIYRGTNLPQLTFNKYTNVTTYNAPASINGGAYDEVINAPWGALTWFGVSRTGTTLTYRIAFGPDKPTDANSRIIGTSNDTTDIGLAATPTAIGPYFQPFATVVTGDMLIRCVSAPPP